MLTTSNTIENKQPDWLDTSLFPFRSNYMDLPEGRMHYIDEGEGEVLLFVHGTPTWSFLYREYIQAFSKNNRCVAIDHLGFGLSDKSPEFQGDPAWHSKNLEAFIDRLGLEQITLVVHDFGGPIGLSYANRHPEKIKRVVLFNSWLWETKSNKGALKVDRFINSFIGRWLYVNTNFSPKLLLREGFSDKKKLSKAVHKHYTKVFSSKDTRYGLLRIAQALVGASDWYQRQWNEVGRLQDKPFLILWGMKDKFFSPEYLEKWKRKFPQAAIHSFDCGHFVQEEAPDESIQVMRRFMDSN